jgi:hypothetical protein
MASRDKLICLRVSDEERQLFKTVAEQNQDEGNLSECIRRLMLREAKRLVTKKGP